MMDNNKRHAHRTAKLIAQSKSADTGVFDGIWHWINGVASGISHFLGAPVTAAFRAVQTALEDILDAFEEFDAALLRLAFWWELGLLHRLEQHINRLLDGIRAREHRDFTYLIRLIHVVSQYVLVTAIRRVEAETAARQRAIGAAEARTRREIRYMHGTIEREAESGYRIERDQRVSTITRLLDYAVQRNPLLRDLVSTIVTGILDLLTIDDPPARLLLGFLVRKVIDRLGIDKAVGDLIGDLAKPILGEPKPDNLHNVIADICTRLSAGEAQWAKFMENGGSQVEQAGREWRDITSVVGNTAIVAFTVQAVVAPERWAAEIRSAVGVPANDILSTASKLFREG